MDNRSKVSHPEKIENILATMVKDKRKKLKISQIELAKNIGISQSLLSRLENGEILISVGILVKLAAALEDEELLRILLHYKRRYEKK
jgi:transcriptional regulator with XRE-family HTH domain